MNKLWRMWSVVAWSLMCLAALPAVAGTEIAFASHTGYFVSNQFEPAAATSFVVLADQAAFDKVFGVAMVMRDKSQRLPADAFASRRVVAAIHRGKAVVSYRVERVVVAEKVLVVRYTTQSEPNATAKFACPLILSVAKGDYDHVQFVEDGKEIQSVAIQPALPVAIKSREADTVTATVEKERTLLVIKGGSGIGQATVRCLAPAWPPVIVVRVYLAGLEQFTISDGRVKLAASILSHSENRQLLHLWRDGKEWPAVEKDSPYWMEIKTHDAAGKSVPGLPAKGGWFEMTVPRALLNENQNLELRWIDFYR